MFRRFSLGGLFSALVLVLLAAPASVRADCPTPTCPPAPACPPPPCPCVAPAPDTSWVSIDVETVVDPEFSHIDCYTSNAIYYVKVYIDYGCMGAGYKIKCQVYDENTGAYADAACGGTPMNPVITYTTPAQGTGTAYFWYPIDATSNWGKSITNGTFTQAWVTCSIQNAAVVVDTDETWLDAVFQRS